MSRSESEIECLGFANKKMKKKEIERLKLKLRAERDPAKVNGSKRQPSVVPRQGLAKVQQPRRRGEV